MSATLFFSVLGATVAGPWLFVVLFGSTPLENHEVNATHLQYWFIGSMLLGIGGIGAWLGCDRQRDIAQRHHLVWIATRKPVVAIHRPTVSLTRSPTKAHLRLVGGTAFRHPQAHTRTPPR